MRVLSLVAALFSVLALIGIPVTWWTDVRRRDNALRVEVEILRIDERFVGTGSSRNLEAFALVRFESPFGGGVLEKTSPIPRRSLGTLAVGDRVTAYYERDAPFPVIQDELPAPGSSVVPLVIASALFGALAAALHLLSRR